MKKSKTKILAVFLVLIMLVAVTKTFAAGYVTFQINPTTKKVAQGNNIEIKVNIANVANQSQGVMGFGADIKYDADAIEIVSVTAANGNWQLQGYNPSNGRFALTSLQAQGATSGDVVTIQARVKSLAAGESTTIKLENATYSDYNYEDGTVADLITTLTTDSATGGNNKNTIPKPQPHPNTNTNQYENQVNHEEENNVVSNEDNQITAEEENKLEEQKTNALRTDDTQAKEVMPKAGIDYRIFLAIPVIAAIGIAIYLRYRNINKDVK